jgi:hypothetical protein
VKFDFADAYRGAMDELAWYKRTLKLVRDGVVHLENSICASNIAGIEASLRALKTNTLPYEA